VSTTSSTPVAAAAEQSSFRFRFFSAISPYDKILTIVWIAAVVMVTAMLFAAAPLGRTLLPASKFHFFPSVLDVVHPKPAEQMRYLLAVVFAVGVGFVVACGGAWSLTTDTGVGRTVIRVGSLAGLISIIGVVAWGWWSQFHYSDGQPATTHFGYGDLGAAIVVALALVFVVRMRPNWIRERASAARSVSTWVYLAGAIGITVCWLLPSVFRAEHLAAASESVTYHLQFTFDDFAAVANGRTPLVNSTEQFASLMPFVIWPVLRLGGVQVGTFTVAMCFLSLIGLISIERVFALVTRNERLAFILYVPFLATSLFFVLRSGSELFSWASYYAEFPMRYVGPYVLFWICTRHLRNMRPRNPILVFVFAGLVVLNNIEFGLPTLGAVIIAMIVGRARDKESAWLIVRTALTGLTIAVAIVCLLTLVWAGALPDLGRLTQYSRIFAEGGYLLLHTPVGGLYLILYLTFAAALIIAGFRYNRASNDGVYTAALAFSGILGLGAGDYYTGRTNPAGLVVLFSIWSISVLLIGLLSLRSISDGGTRASRPSAILIAFSVVAMGLTITSITQFPAPWTQIKRIESSAPPPRPYNLESAVNLVRRTASRGERVMLLVPLGHIIAIDADVINVSPFSNPGNVVTYEQLDEVFEALGRAHSSRVYVETDTYPEITHSLTACGFRPDAGGANGIVEWQLRKVVCMSRLLKSLSWTGEVAGGAGPTP
jgi:hypothetical protein